MAARTLSGSCVCGGITFTSTEAPQHLDYCYCLTCQQISGAPFMAWTGITKASLEINLNSRPLIYKSTLGTTGKCVSKRVCCGECGCNIILQYDLYPDKTHVAASTIRHNGFETPKVGCHIWCRHVPSWHTIAKDGVPRYDEFDEDFRSRLEQHLEKLKEANQS